MNGIAIDLTNVEVVLHLFHTGRGDAVGGAVDPFRRRRALFFAQRFPKGALDQRDDSAGGLGRAAVVFASHRFEADVNTGRAQEGGRGFWVDCVPGLPESTDVAGDVAGDAEI